MTRNAQASRRTNVGARPHIAIISSVKAAKSVDHRYRGLIRPPFSATAIITSGTGRRVADGRRLSGQLTAIGSSPYADLQTAPCRVHGPRQILISHGDQRGRCLATVVVAGQGDSRRAVWHNGTGRFSFSARRSRRATCAGRHALAAMELLTGAAALAGGVLRVFTPRRCGQPVTPSEAR
jgi:hypothetical protein